MPSTGCFAADLADAVRDDLAAAVAAGELSMAFEPTRPKTWLVRHPLKSLGTLRVTVVPAPKTLEMASLDLDDETQAIDVAIQRLTAINPEDQPDCDPLGRLAEEILRRYRGRRLTTAEPNPREAVCTERALIPGSEALVAREHLEDLGVFTCIARLTFHADA